jgi:hypothetical protein
MAQQVALHNDFVEALNRVTPQPALSF